MKASILKGIKKWEYSNIQTPKKISKTEAIIKISLSIS